MFHKTLPRSGVLLVGLVCWLGLGLLIGCGTTRDAGPAPYAEHATQPLRLDSQNLDQHPNAAVLQWVSEHPAWRHGWAELTRRKKADALPDDDALKAMRILIACLEAQTPTGNPIAFSRADLFVAEVYHAGLIDDATLRAYTKAFVGEQFRFNDTSTVRGSGFARLFGTFGTNVEEMQGSGLPYRLIWQVREVRLDGEVITPDQIGYSLMSVNIILNPREYAAGTYRIEIAMDAGLALREEATDFNQRRTQAEDWPETKLRWRVSQKARLTID